MDTPDFKIHEANEEAKEAFARYNYFVPVNEHIVKKCDEMFKNNLRPDHVILLKTERLYKSLAKTLNSMPTSEKNALGQNIRECILNLRTHILRSANIYSAAISEAKSASCELSSLQGHIDLMYAMQFISTPFHFKLCDQLSDIALALDLWFDVLK